MNKTRKLLVDLTPYLKWYCKWINWKTVTIEDFQSGKVTDPSPYTMLDEWLDQMAVPINKLHIGQDVFYSINAEHQDELCYDTWLEGCIIKGGKITDISDRFIEIDRIPYTYHTDSDFVFLKPEYCVLSMTYDGDSMFEGPVLSACYSRDLLIVDGTAHVDWEE